MLPREKTVYHKPYGFIHTFYVVGEIGPASNYIEWFEILSSMGENDIGVFRVNSPGGDADTIIQLISSIQKSEAKIAVMVEGQAASAATFLLMVADVVEMSRHSTVMLHNYSGGLFGKGGELFDRVTYERKWSENLLRDMYTGFLTESEMVALLDGRDMWFDCDETLSRIETRQKYLDTIGESNEGKTTPENPDGEPRDEKDDSDTQLQLPLSNE